jgi:ribose transport system ATP-binding protein
VAIARALATDAGDEPSVLVLDEPTATLPAPEVVELLRNLRRVASTGVAILYVTHHLDEVFRIADDVSVLRDGALVASGPTQTFTHRQLVHHLVGSELEAIRAPDRPSDGHQAGRKDMRLVVEDLVADGVNGMSFTVAPGEIVGIYGVTGSGRDAVLGAVFGARGREAGQVQVAGSNVPARQPHHSIRLGVGYVPANRRTHGAVIEMSAAENLTLPALSSFWRRGRLDVPGEKRDADTWFSKLEVRPANGTQLPLASFSGGNQQKVVLAKWLRQDPCLLLLDEPTQGVDIGAKAVIHRAILAAVDDGLSVVIASSDDEEVASLCSRVHVVQHGRIVDTVVGADITEAELRRRLNTAHRPTLTTDGDQ